ncbi:LOW QUALITY PROTEIN: hypothetical protein OSB04_006407 [Centaurea solstitialis]|uniref:CCHC-type domain-containing protein n=1 Tax=Centaurea solstitialis TaxID=347529 RepID=A0AA38WHF3_9ASTR|nr:LOW QUALITY PROTEIN: hypothetical protein OSB04_006407 [Centaurea solstitialis]
MASTVTSTNNLSLRSILEKDKLTGSNFLDWERNLMIVLRHERKWYVLEEPLGEAPPANAPAAARNAHKKHSDDLLDVACLMLATMSPDLQAGLINTNAYDMIRQLRDMFQTQARTERYDATKAFNECKMVKGTSVSDHVMKMKRHLDHLERLGHPVPLQLATNTILNSLSEDYRPFVVNYNMNNMEKTIAELHSMLKTAELNMGNKNKTKDVLMVKDGGVKKKNGQASTSKGKGPVQAIQSAPKKGKGKGKGKGKKVKPNKARTENRCFICNEIGHWRQNCPKRHEAEVKCPEVAEDLKHKIPVDLPRLQMESDFRNWKLVQVSEFMEYDKSLVIVKLLSNSYKCCRLKVAQIFDRVANIGRDPRLRLLLGSSHNSTRRTFVGRSPVDYHQAIQDTYKNPTKRTETTPYLPAYEVEKPYDMYSAEQRAQAAIDKRALTLLTMALPNDMYARLQGCPIHVVFEQQMQRGEKALESQRENAMNAYEGFCARDGETLTDSYNRLNSYVNDLRRLGLETNKYEVNVKFLKRLSSQWQAVTISIQVSQNLGKLELHDLYSMMLPHEETLFRKKEKKIDPLALAAVPLRGSNFHQSSSFQENYTVEEPIVLDDGLTEEEMYQLENSLALMAKFHGNPQRFNKFRHGPHSGGGQSSQGGYQQRDNFQRNDQGRSRDNYHQIDSSGFNNRNQYNQGSYQNRDHGYNNNYQQREYGYNNGYQGNGGNQGGGYNQGWNNQSGPNNNNN